MATSLQAVGADAEWLAHIEGELEGWLVRDADLGEFKLAREVFTDPALFELEMKHIFGRGWVYLAHESQIGNPNDFLSTYIGRSPVILTRDRSGEVRAFLNVCSHRGARVCRERSGNRKTFTCPFHGWTYGNDGKLLDVTEEAAGAYPEGFDRAKLGLEPVARVESYRGFVFGSLSPDVPALSDYLAGAKTMIDLIVDQSPDGRLEVLRGATRYIYKGNWKLQVENGLDGYHIGSVHGNYLMTVSRRTTGQSDNDTKVFDFGRWNKLEGGSYSFDHGHAVIWNDYANFQDRPSWEIIDWLKAERGEERARWMNGRMRNLMLFPNVFLMDQTSSQIRIIRPLSVDETEITTYCIAPVGESAKARAIRIRQYEDFFNASGMATPDDLTEFNNCQIGYRAVGELTNDLSRGATRWKGGTDAHGEEIGVDAVLSCPAIADEGLYVAIYEAWRERVRAALASEKQERATAR